MAWLDPCPELFDNPHMGYLLRTDGLVKRPLNLAYEALLELPGQVPDLALLVPGRRGGVVMLNALLNAAGACEEAEFITLSTSDGAFSASVPLNQIREQGIVVYRDVDGPLSEAQGGPVRFLIKDIEACRLGSGEIDRCANVKHLFRIELSSSLGRDTRPGTQLEHEALHEDDPGHSSLRD